MFLADLNNNQAAQIGESLRMALDAANAGCWEWEPATNVNQWSKNLHKLYGIDPSIAPSYDAWRYSIHPVDRAAAEHCVNSALAAGVAFDCQWRVNAIIPERWLFARGRPIKDAAGQVTSYIGIVIDITQQKRAEMNAAAREQQLHAIIDALPAMVAYINVQGHYVFANQPYKKAFGIADTDLHGNQVSRLLGSDFNASMQSHLQKVRGGQVARFFTRVAFVDGQPHDLQVTLLPDLMTGGAFQGIYAFIDDRTEAMQAEAELQKLRAQLEDTVRQQIAEQTVAAVAHELNQPLNAASTFSEAVRRMLLGGHSSAEIRAAANRVQTEIQRAGDILRELLTSLQQGPQHTPASRVDGNEFVQGVVESYKNTNSGCKGQLVFAPCAAPVPIEVDRAAMEKVLLNLLHNARDALAQNAFQWEAKIEVRTVVKDRMVEISVADNGVGIPPNMAGQLFQPLRSMKPQGIGMGLAICKRLVELHGGNIWLAKSDGGATFTFSLPLAP